VVRGNLAVVGRILVLHIFLFLYYCVFIMQEFGVGIIKSQEFIKMWLFL
jgi:hypothetical protein